MYINRRDGDAAKAIFCLAPTGLGFGVRVYHAMADGCIPLVISDNITQPWEGDFLPYSLFAVRLPESDIPRCAVLPTHMSTPLSIPATLSPVPSPLCPHLCRTAAIVSHLPNRAIQYQTLTGPEDFDSGSVSCCCSLARSASRPCNGN
jgi:hypothetical protein